MAYRLLIIFLCLCGPYCFVFSSPNDQNSTNGLTRNGFQNANDTNFSAILHQLPLNISNFLSTNCKGNITCNYNVVYEFVGETNLTIPSLQKLIERYNHRINTDNERNFLVLLPSQEQLNHLLDYVRLVFRVPTRSTDFAPAFSLTPSVLFPLQDRHIGSPNVTGVANIKLTAISSTPSPQPHYDQTICGVFPTCTIRSIFIRNTTILANATCDRTAVTITAAVTIVLSVVIFFSNFFIIIVTFRSMSVRGYFKISLAFADAIAGAIVLPSVVYNIFVEIQNNQLQFHLTALVEIRQNPAAMICGIAGILSTVTAVYSLLLLSIDSFLSIRWPMKYRIGDIMTKSRALFAVAILWSISLFIALLPLFTTNFMEYGLNYITLQYIPVIKPDLHLANNRYWHAILYAVFVWGLPFITTWILTIITLFESRRMLNGMRIARRQSVKSANTLDKVEQDFRRTVFVVLVVFTLTILPVFAVVVWMIVMPIKLCIRKPTTVAFFISTYILICGRFLNVVIYNIFNKKFREDFKMLFRDMLIFLTCNDKASWIIKRKSRSSQKSTSFWLPLSKKTTSTSKQQAKLSTASLSKDPRSPGGNDEKSLSHTERAERNSSSSGADTL